MYAFAYDDPVNFNDPRGALSCWIFGLDFGGVGGDDGGSACSRDPCSFLINNFGPQGARMPIFQGGVAVMISEDTASYRRGRVVAGWAALRGRRGPVEEEFASMAADPRCGTC
jgi:hypothetical protein